MEFSQPLLNSPITPYPNLGYYTHIFNTPYTYTYSWVKPTCSDNNLTLDNSWSLNSLWRIYQNHVKLNVDENRILHKQITDLKLNVCPFIDVQHFKMNFKDVPPKIATNQNSIWTIRSIETQTNLNLREENSNETSLPCQEEYPNKLSKSKLLENSESNKASFKRILNEEAENDEEIAFYFHLNPSLSPRFKTDLMTTITKFKKLSSVPSLSNAKLFLNKLATDSKLKSSTIAKYAWHLQI